MATSNRGVVGPSSVAPGEHRPSATSKQRGRTTIPTQSGKWILGKTIGAGSMGKVKLARKEDGVEQVACKIIPRSSGEDNQHSSRADKERADHSKEIRTAREAAIVTLLSHPHICGLKDVIRTNHHWYMLFEFVNGGQMLDYIISHGKLKEKQARKFSRQIASALDYCHRNSIVHRDLKIENILISKTGDIKIIDFGLSNLFTPKGYLKTFCGSLYFAAPELLQARAYTGPEVDVWSFGIVLYVLVCGKVPFDDQSMPALHAKIKKGNVDYPNWLSGECKHLLSRMLVTDPKQRATMQDVMSHPWMTKGYGAPPENFLPNREPLTLPLDEEVINSMTGFNFGSPESIKNQLMKVIESEEYHRAVHFYQKERDMPQPPRDVEKRRMLGFDFYKRRNSNNSRDHLTMPSTEGLQLGNDPLNAFSPLISIYYLVREKQERDRIDVPPPSPQPPIARNDYHSTVGSSTGTENDITNVPLNIPAQEPSYYKDVDTNTPALDITSDMIGDSSRPRNKAYGGDELAIESPELVHSSSVSQCPDARIDLNPKKESGATGLLRRFSTRRKGDRSHPPSVHIQTPTESVVPRKSFSIRRSRRDRDDDLSPRVRSGSTQPRLSDHLSPPLPLIGSRGKGLGRSTSVNSADMRRRASPQGLTTKVPPHNIESSGPVTPTDIDATDPLTAPNIKQPSSTSYSQPLRSVSMRAKSIGSARRESIQLRRLRREEAREAHLSEDIQHSPSDDPDHDNDAAHFTDVDQGEQCGISTDKLGEDDLAKPVFLKGLFSVSTTSPKSVPEIRTEVRLVLRQLDVDYTEIKGGFVCRHAPSIDLKKVADPSSSPLPTSGHKRRFSFGALRGSTAVERDCDNRGDFDQKYHLVPRAPIKTPTFTDRPNRDSNSSVDSIVGAGEEGEPGRRAPGETTTQIQNDLGGSMIVKFEIFIVKVPLFSLHGIQFKRMAGNTWQFKNMADQILKELHL